MEIEVNWRAVILLVILVAIVLAGLFLAPRFLVAGKKPVAETTPVVTDTPPVQEVVANPVDIEFHNESAWQVTGVEECLPKLQSWLGDRYQVESITFVITNTVTANMAVGTVFPDPRESWPPDVSVKGICEEEAANQLTCIIGVEKGGPGPKLDMAASVEMAQLVADFYRPRTKEAWSAWTKNWKWENFQPLIIKENDQWTSDCLHLAR